MTDKPLTVAEVAAILYPQSPEMQARYIKLRSRAVRPARSLLDPAFQYVLAINTNIRARFDAIRAEQRAAAETAEAKRLAAEAEHEAHRARLHQGFERRRQKLRVAK